MDNADGFLTPGMFGNMRLATGGKTKALLVPETAVQTDQTRKQLLVVDSKGNVAIRQVELGPIVDGLRVIRSGLKKTDRVVIDGTQLAAPGSQVKTEKGTIKPNTPSAAERSASQQRTDLPASAATIPNTRAITPPAPTFPMPEANDTNTTTNMACFVADVSASTSS